MKIFFRQEPWNWCYLRRRHFAKEQKCKFYRRIFRAPTLAIASVVVYKNITQFDLIVRLSFFQ